MHCQPQFPCWSHGELSKIPMAMQVQCCVWCPPPKGFCLWVLFILKYLCIIYLFLTVSGLSCGMRALSLQCVSFSLVKAHRFGCPAARGILVPQPGIKPMSPELESGFLTTGPPGQSSWVLFEAAPHRTQGAAEDGGSCVYTLLSVEMLTLGEVQT